MAQAERTPTIVTHENAEAYYNERLGIGQEAAPVEATETPAPEADKETEEGEESPEVLEKAHKEGKLSARFKELTTARKTAESAAQQLSARLREEADARRVAEQAASDLRAKYEPPKADLGPEPKPEQFNNTEEYAAAIKDWAAENAIRTRDAQEAERVSKEHDAAIAKEWGERLTATKNELADYDAKIMGSPVKVSDEVRSAILESEVGPKLLYHLAEHPEVADKIGKMTVVSALREIGRLEAGLIGTPKAPESPKAEISKAPAPISPLKGGNSTPSVMIDSNGEFHGTFQAYKAARKAGKIK